MNCKAGLGFLFLLLASSAHAQAPALIPVQGTLTDSSGVPIDGSLDVTFSIYADDLGATLIFTETQSVSFDAGAFTVYIGDVTDLDLSIFRDFGGTYLGIAVGGDPEMPLVQLGSVPTAGYAEYCGNAASLAGLSLTEVQDSVVASVGAHYTDAQAVAALSPHTSDTAAHHARYTDAEAVGALSGHTSDAAAHHARYTDAEAVSACLASGAFVDSGSGMITSDLAVGGAVSAGGTIDGANTITGSRVSTIRVRGTGLNYPGNQDRNIIVDGADQANNTRGLHLTVLSRVDHSIVSNQFYDTHGDPTAADTMASDLNALGPDSVVLIASYDAWVNSLTTALRDALARVGASQRVLQIALGGPGAEVTRSSYALVGIPGSGVDSGFEMLMYSSAGVAEIGALLVDGDLVGYGQHRGCPPGWVDLGASCIEPSRMDNASWIDTANHCYSIKARMCTPYEMYIAISQFGPALDIGPTLSHPHVDQLAADQTAAWTDRVVVQGWTAPTAVYGNWTPTDQNANSRAMCCIDK